MERWMEEDVLSRQVRSSAVVPKAEQDSTAAASHEPFYARKVSKTNCGGKNTKVEWVSSSVLVISIQRKRCSSLLDAKHKLKIVCSASGCTPLERTFAASGRNGNNPRRCCARLVEGDKGCAGTFSR